MKLEKIILICLFAFVFLINLNIVYSAVTYYSVGKITCTPKTNVTVGMFTIEHYKISYRNMGILVITVTSSITSCIDEATIQKILNKSKEVCEEIISYNFNTKCPVVISVIGILFVIFCILLITSFTATIISFKKFRNHKRILRLSITVLLFSTFSLISILISGFSIGYPLPICRIPPTTLASDGMNIKFIPCDTPLIFSLIFFILDILFFYVMVYLVEKAWFKIKNKLIAIITIIPPFFFLIYHSIYFYIPIYLFYILYIYSIWLIVLPFLIYGIRACRWLIYSIVIGIIAFISDLLLLPTPPLFFGQTFLFHINPLFYLSKEITTYTLIETIFVYLTLYITSVVIIGFIIHELIQFVRKKKYKYEYIKKIL